MIRFDDLQIGEKIGQGSFGTVKLGTWNDKKVAVKQMIKQNVDNSILEIQAESAMLSITKRMKEEKERKRKEKKKN